MRLVKGLLAAAAAVSFSAGTVGAEPLPIVIIGTPARDILTGTRHDDIIWGRQGNDSIVGSRGNDVLLGQRGNDTLRAAFPLGLSGSDVVRGGRGVDRCIGDSTDTFRGCEVIIRRGG
jgi:Ca2+-binding RTX toxin-like protein